MTGPDWLQTISAFVLKKSAFEHSSALMYVCVCVYERNVYIYTTAIYDNDVDDDVNTRVTEDAYHRQMYHSSQQIDRDTREAI